LSPSPIASIVAQSRPACAGEAVIPILPRRPVGSPLLRLISAQVSPPSFERQIPESGPPLLSAQG
jgi:hypothetical protein